MTEFRAGLALADMCVSPLPRHWGPVATAVCLLVCACATSPRGRKQLIFFSEQEMQVMGNRAFEELKKEQRLANQPQLTRYVECVTDRVVAVLEQPEGRRWEVVVFADPQANAFALPGGKIGVFRGMLDIASTQDQLAAVIAHEVGHVIARHGAERVSQRVVIEGGLAAVSAAVGDGVKGPLIMGALGLGATVGVLLPYSRTHEAEADAIGMSLMARAGFNPKAAVTLWQKMARANGEQPPEFLSTHPAPSTRIEELQAQLPQARALYKEARRKGREPSCTPP